MCRVYEEIGKASTNECKWSQAHIHIESKAANPTAFDMFQKDYQFIFLTLNGSIIALNLRKPSCANIASIAFLPYKLQSICGKQHSDKKLSEKKFSDEYWEESTQDYSLSHEIVGEEDNDSSTNPEDFDSD
ncbi:hypothetical protein O181_090394 [Austropuccinia psidii MF-1]|uniref:Uncharacterized protein n=1 Tax=Austropuccinia psidii MF-1 TaxID=1389203 RepID=A0A9Q3IVC5_9BASI|nr:hypothetical protein [Austropuccinia psidii MF-1]